MITNKKDSNRFSQMVTNKMHINRDSIGGLIGVNGSSIVK